MRLKFYDYEKRGETPFITVENGDAPSIGDTVSFEKINKNIEFLVKNRRFLYHDKERIGYNAVATVFITVEEI